MDAFSQTWGRVNASLSCNDAAGAERALRQLDELRPDDPEVLLQLGDTLCKLGRHADAMTPLTRVLERHPDHERAWLTAGLALAGAGDLQHAEAALGRAVRVNPQNGRGWLELGRIRARMGRRGAEHCYRQALLADPEDMDARTALAFTLLHRGAVDAAGVEFARVLERDPSQPAAIGGAAAVLDRRRHPDSAWALLQAYANTGPPDTRIAVVAASVGRRLRKVDQAAAMVDRALKATDSTPDLVLLHHARGDLHEARGAHRKAFASWKTANQLRGLKFDGARHLRAIDRVCALLDERRFAELPHGRDSEQPVFIVGMPRSGTSLIEQILAMHPDIGAGGELETLRDIAVAIPREGEADWLDALPRMDRSLCEGLGAAYLESVRSIAGEGFERITDKMPNNFLHLGLAAHLMPGARVIHCVRDPLDTGLSCFQQGLGSGLAWATSLDGIASWYIGYTRLMAHWQRVLPLRIHTLQYERLVEDPEPTLRALCAFLDLPYTPELLQFHTSQRQVATASATQVQQPLHTRSVGRARAYRTQLMPLVRAARRHGVELITDR